MAYEMRDNNDLYQFSALKIISHYLMTINELDRFLSPAFCSDVFTRESLGSDGQGFEKARRLRGVPLQTRVKDKLGGSNHKYVDAGTGERRIYYN